MNNKKWELKPNKNKRLKVYQIREDQAWGPNDRGHTIGYIRANSKEDAREKYGSDSGFIQFFEISDEDFEIEIEKTKAYLNLLLNA